jgi:hypothetical protein
MKSDVNHFIQNVMGLSEFHNTLLPIILQFGGNISAMEAFALRFLRSATTAGFSYFDHCFYLHSHQGLFMVDLLDNFLSFLSFFWLW